MCVTEKMDMVRRARRGQGLLLEREEKGGRQTEQEATSLKEQALCYVTRMKMASLGQPLSLPALYLYLRIQIVV